MIEKLYGNIPSYGKSYFTEKVDEMYISMVKKSLDCTIHDLLNSLHDENEQLKQQLKLEEAEERINCRNCIYFISGSSSDSCLKREDIGYKGTCIDGMDYHYLAKNCPYY